MRGLQAQPTGGGMGNRVGAHQHDTWHGTHRCKHWHGDGLGLEPGRVRDDLPLQEPVALLAPNHAHTHFTITRQSKTIDYQRMR